jgi:diguanylate cyclase (GGDEF)-like protein
MNHKQLLAGIPLFTGLSDDELAIIEGLTRERSYEAQQNIVTVGQRGDTLFMILAGEVQVLYPARSQDFELARLGPGEFFGEMALLNDEPRSATVRTLEPTRVLVLGKDDFQTIIQSSPTVALKLLEVLSVRIRNTDEQLSGLSEQALRDPLTGLLNRRAFHERMAEEGNRAQRYGENFALILLDVDRFKSINDTFGHGVGDDLLRWLGRVLMEHTRVADSPFRIGGEEFAILAPTASPDVAMAVGERIRRVVEESRPPLEKELHMTISGGFAACPLHGTRPEVLFQIADQALFRAKELGRNRVEAPVVPEGGLGEVPAF